MKGDREQRPETAGGVAAVRCEASLSLILAPTKRLAAYCNNTAPAASQQTTPVSASTLWCLSPLNEACQDHSVRAIVSLFYV